jgi:hypothetical protein
MRAEATNLDAGLTAAGYRRRAASPFREGWGSVVEQRYRL